MDFDFWPWDQGHQISIFCLPCCDYSLQFLSISVKPFRMYSKIKYFLTFDLGFWPLSLGSRSPNFQILFSMLLWFFSANFINISLLFSMLLWLFSANFNNIGKALKIYSKMQYLTLDFDLWPWNLGHQIPTFYFYIQISTFLYFIIVIIQCKL